METKIESIKTHLTTGEIREQSESLWSYKVFYDGIDLGAVYYHPGNIHERKLGISYFMSFPLSETETDALKKTSEWKQMETGFGLRIKIAEEDGYFQLVFHMKDEIKQQYDNLHLKFIKEIADTLKEFEPQ